MFATNQFIEANRYKLRYSHRSTESYQEQQKRINNKQYAAFKNSKKKYSGKALARKRKQAKRLIAQNVSLSKGCPAYKKQLEIRK